MAGGILNWDSQPTQFLSTLGATFYKEGHHPVPPEISRMNLEIDKIFIQLQMQNTMEAFPEGFHIFHLSKLDFCH